jgi:cyanate permease
MTNEPQRRHLGRHFGWSVLLVGGLVLMLFGIAGKPTIGSVDLSAITVIVAIAVVLGDAIWVARTS